MKEERFEKQVYGRINSSIELTERAVVRVSWCFPNGPAHAEGKRKEEREAGRSVREMGRGGLLRLCALWGVSWAAVQLARNNFDTN